jgi:type IV pilus assembly protein PilX
MIGHTKLTRLSIIAFTPSRQKGAVLVMALVILVVMTILGVTVMNTTSLGEKMAGNLQESTRAFQTSESGVEHSFQDGTSLASLVYPGQSTSETITIGTTTAVVQTTYTQRGNKPKRALDRANIYSITDYGTANFELKSTGKTTTSAKAVVTQGVAQITPKNN